MGGDCLNIENAVKNLDYICDTKQIKSILFNLTYNDMDCRIIYAKQSKVILIAIREKNVAWFVPIESGGQNFYFCTKGSIF